MKASRLLLVLVSISSCLVACDKVHELDERTKGMADTTAEMKDITSHMYPQIRTKESEDTRNKKMQVILDQTSGMGAKVAASAIYFQSFEFQFWTNNKTFDTSDVRESLFVDAANEFFRRASDIYTRMDLEDLSPLIDDPKDKSNEMAFLSLSVAMHMINHHQEHIWKTSYASFERKSFYDLMTSAVIKDFKKLPMSMAEGIFVTGTNKMITEELLKARVNMLTALAVSYMVDKQEINDSGLYTQGLALLAKVSQGRWGSIKLTSLYEGSNEVTQKEVMKRLEGALATKQLLQKIGIAVKMDPLLMNIMKNIAFPKDQKVQSAESLMEYTRYRSLVKELSH